jgi:diguanylate cyclase (GGDEF)-like protein
VKRDGRRISRELLLLFVIIASVYAAAAVTLVVVKVGQTARDARVAAEFRADLAARVLSEAVGAAMTTLEASAAAPSTAAAIAAPPDGCSLQFSLMPFRGARLDLVAPSGETLCSSAAVADGGDARSSPWRAGADVDGPRLSNRFIDPATTLAAVAISARVTRVDGVLAGYVVAVLPVAGLSDELSATFGGPGGFKFAVVSGGGSVLSVSDQTEATVTDASAADPLGAHVLTGKTPVDGTDWVVVAGIPRWTAVGEVLRTLAWAIGLGAGSLMLMLFLVMLVNRRIVRPIVQLSGAMGRSHHTSVDVVDVGGPAELRQLAGEFAELIAARDTSAEILVHQALRDPLTGLANRALLSDRLTQALDAQQQQHDAKIVVLLVDIDRFKRVNESFGHSAGDEVLATVATRLQRALRPGDTVGRIGGDQFVITTEVSSDAPDGAALAERLLGVVQEPLEVADTVISLSASIGVARADASSTTESLLRDVDVATNEAKQRGRARHHIFDPRMQVVAPNRLLLENELRHAIDRNELWVAYQPIATAHAGSCVGVESLLRWDHPGIGSISPAQFIPAAEDSGLIIPIGAFVLDQACRQLAAWRSIHLDVSVSVNVSARQIEDGRLIQQVSEALASHDIDPAGLCIEITESLLMVNPNTAVLLRELKELGVKLSLDDFGTGYSSLAYLHRFPVDELKIDRSFIIDVDTNPSARTLVDAIIAMSHALGLRVVAEGVETREQLRVLQDLDCDLIQGFLYGRPDCADAIAALLTSRLPTVRTPTST